MIQIEVIGISARPSVMKIKKKRLFVGISNDDIGKSLSIYDKEKDVMFQIPMDQLLRYFKDGAE